MALTLAVLAVASRSASPTVRTPGGPGGSGSRSVSATTRVRRGVAPV
jgi:hypothetical protein